MSWKDAYPDIPLGRDACGIIAMAEKSGKPSHRVVRRTLESLYRMAPGSYGRSSWNRRAWTRAWPITPASSWATSSCPRRRRAGSRSLRTSCGGKGNGSASAPSSSDGERW